MPLSNNLSHNPMLCMAFMHAGWLAVCLTLALEHADSVVDLGMLVLGMSLLGWLSGFPLHSKGHPTCPALPYHDAMNLLAAFMRSSGCIVCW